MFSRAACCLSFRLYRDQTSRSRWKQHSRKYFTDIKGTESHSDMPGIKLYKENLNWKISVHEYAPGPGPGDFDLVCGTEDQAVNEILHYFFDQNEWVEAASEAAQAFLDKRHKQP